MAPLVRITRRAGVTDRGQGEETFGSTEHAPEFVERVVRVALLEGPEQPTMKGE